MTDDNPFRGTRRGYLTTVGAVGVAATTAGCSSEDDPADTDTPEATDTDEPPEPTETAESTETPQSDAFPPADRTAWGGTVNLGEGTVSTFTTVRESGNTQYHGFEIDRAAFEGLPRGRDLRQSGDEAFTDKYGPDGEAVEIHFEWSLEFFVPFPGTQDTPFTFLGFNWNPQGHPPGEVWTFPHFDIHFHMAPMASTDAIAGPRAPDYELPEAYIPEGYARGPVVEERVITDMGEHLADLDAPEMNEGEFTNTLIWGLYDHDGDGVAEHSYVEPMITLEYLQDFSSEEQWEIRQPGTYAYPGRYPTAYSVRDVPSRDSIVVTIEEFDFFAGDR